MSGYRLPVPDGRYRVTLKMVENFFTAPGSRVFDVTAEGSTVLSGFDPFAAAGGRGRAVDRSFTTTVTGGALDLGFRNRRNYASVAGIEVVPVATAAATSASPTPAAPATTAPAAAATTTAATTTTTGTAALRFRPPALVNPVTVHVSAAAPVVKLPNPAQDYVVVLPSTPIDVRGGLQIKGGRNVVVRGGEIHFAADYGTGAYDNRALIFNGNAYASGRVASSTPRTIHVEGLKISGYCDEGIQFNLNGDKNVTVQLENIDTSGATFPGSYSGHHADVVQWYNGPLTMRMDRVFVPHTGYQAFFAQPSTYGTEDGHYSWDLDNVYVGGDPTSAYLFWDSGIAPADLHVGSSVYGNPPSSKALDLWLWPKPSLSPAWSAMHRGARTADQVLSGHPGTAYVSPGYR
jgi:hypothetical protein